MRPTPWQKVEAHRITTGPYGTHHGDPYGAFLIPGPCATELKVIVSGPEAPPYSWEHVSVSTRNRCPNWAEMEFVKDLFFREDECAMQLHVPRAEHISFHPYCLHLWRPTHCEIPRPPNELVGAPKEVTR